MDNLISSLAEKKARATVSTLAELAGMVRALESENNELREELAKLKSDKCKSEVKECKEKKASKKEDEDEYPMVHVIEGDEEALKDLAKFLYETIFGDEEKEEE